MNRWRWSLLLLACCSLEACTPFAVGSAIGGAVGGSFASDRRCMQAIADDRMIHYQADLRLQSASALKGTRIVVADYNHIVLLVGQVQTESQRQLAKEIVQGVPTVKYIYNKLEIAPPLSPMAQSKDAWITTKIVSSMLPCTDLNTTQIKVVTEDGTVYLMGIVTEHQGRAAAEIARRVSGVKRVIKLFEYARVPHG